MCGANGTTCATRFVARLGEKKNIGGTAISELDYVCNARSSSRSVDIVVAAYLSTSNAGVRFRRSVDTRLVIRASGSVGGDPHTGNIYVWVVI